LVTGELRRKRRRVGTTRALVRSDADEDRRDRSPLPSPRSALDHHDDDLTEDDGTTTRS
jgi:hypothetical protein